MAIMYEFESGINIVDRVDVIDEGEEKKKNSTNKDSLKSSNYSSINFDSKGNQF